MSTAPSERQKSQETLHTKLTNHRRTNLINCLSYNLTKSRRNWNQMKNMPRQE